MFTQYDIETEAFPNVWQLVAKRFQGAKLRYGHGLWKGQLEDSVTITLLDDTTYPATFRADVDDLIQDILVTNQQEAVGLVVLYPASIRFVFVKP